MQKEARKQGKAGDDEGQGTGKVEKQNDDLDGLLDEEEDDDLDEEEEDDDLDEDDEDDDEDDSAEDVAERAAELLESKIESMFDRRVNAVLKEIRGDKPKGRTKSREGRVGSTGVVSSSTIRAARAAYRDYLPDEIRLTSREERTFATDYGRALIAARAIDGFDDEDLVGSEVAKQVGDTIKALRRGYETRIRKALEKKGVLMTDKSGGPSGGAKPTPSPSKEFADGASLAARRHGTSTDK